VYITSIAAVTLLLLTVADTFAVIADANPAKVRGFSSTLHGLFFLLLLLLLLLLRVVNMYCRSSAAATASRGRANCRSIVLRA
jgi:hypothetical protein